MRIAAPYDYADEKLYQGMLTLAAADGPLRARLKNAWVSWFHRISLQPSFPPALQERWEGLHNEVRAVPGQSGESAYEASIDAMDDEAVVRHAEGIVGLFWEFEHFLISGKSENSSDRTTESNNVLLSWFVPPRVRRRPTRPSPFGTG